jgi:putative AdoMet-dependent methyltransferase
VYNFDPTDADERIDTWLSDAVSDPAIGWTRSELAEHVHIEFSTYSWLLESLLERTGFEILDRDYRQQIYGAYTCRRVA